MIKEIKYNGFSATPSDYECPDGDLAQMVNFVPEDGALHPTQPCKTLFTIPEGYKLAYIHDTSTYKHYIFFSCVEDGGLWDYSAYWIDGENTPSSIEPADLTQIPQYTYTTTSADDVPNIIGIGNTLIIYDKSAMTYVLWNNNTYKYLGTHLPEIELRMGLLGHPRFYGQEYNGSYRVTFDPMRQRDFENGAALSDENKTTITNQVMAKLNKFVADTTVGKGMHCFPFFVRYALRLYDGTLAMHSAPILMNPCTHGGPVVYVKSYNITSTGPDELGGNVDYCDVDMMLMASQITYKACTNYTVDVNKWKDIVKSVDVFVSKPMYTYNQDGLIDSFHDSDNLKTKFIGKLYSKETASSITKDCVLGPIQDNEGFINGKYSEWKYEQICALYYPLDTSNRSIPSYTLHLPEFNTDKTKETLESESSFYLLHSIPFEDIGANGTNEVVINTPDDYLQSLLAREVLTDDYQSHDSLIPGTAFQYNNRMNFASIDKVFFGGFTTDTIWAKCEGDHTFTINGQTITINYARILDPTEKYNLYVFIKDDNGEHVVSSGQGGFTNYFYSYGSTPTYNHSSCCWFFYPNPNAYKAVIHDGMGNGYEIELKAHPMLNGAFAMLEYEGTRTSSIMDEPSEDNTSTFIPNKIYTSEINNPFFFPLLGINTIGSGRILGLASATKALSQGQFGQFPLYAFTTDGVWALEVSNTGAYSSKQPVTRDVVVGDGRSITQIDSAVLFATNRGIMILEGSTSQCISDVLFSEYPFLISDVDTATNAVSTLISNKFGYIPTMKPFLKFIEGCRMCYDYVHQRIIVYNSESEIAAKYAYVFSLKDKKWGMMESNLLYGLPSYPDALAVAGTAGGDELVNLSDFRQLGTNEYLQGMLVTRPLKLEMADILKTIDTIIQRGFFEKEHNGVKTMQTLLWGSRDMFHWHLVWTSQDHILRGFSGTSYKYFRIGLLTSMLPNESIYGATIQLEAKLINQPR